MPKQQPWMLAPWAPNKAAREAGAVEFRPDEVLATAKAYGFSRYQHGRYTEKALAIPPADRGDKYLELVGLAELHEANAVAAQARLMALLPSGPYAQPRTPHA